MKEEKMLALLRELIKNSRRSDRELAKAIRASQPTVTRNRKLLGKFIRSYTIVPEFSKVDYEILALTFARVKAHGGNEGEARIDAARKWVMQRPNIVFSSDGEGLGKDTVIVSLHRNYSRYADFIREYSINFTDCLSDIQSFIVSLKTGLVLKPFDLAYLADDMKTSE